MNNDQLGKLASPGQARDAIHIAIAPVLAAEKLRPGTHVGIVENGFGKCSDPIGIVDPFLTASVDKGSWFWLLLYPNTITSLRHEWVHPAFTAKGVPVASESERWLRDFADEVDADYWEMMEVAKSHCRNTGKNYGDPGYRWPEYLIEGGKWEGQPTPDEFWTHFTNVTGMKPDGDDSSRPGIFSCSC